MGGRHRGAREERGTVTAELAVALPSLALLLATALAAITAAAVQLECVDAARAGARALARGDDTASVRSRTASIAPAGAAIDIGAATGLARVRVSAPVSLGPLIGSPLRVSGRASVPMEPSVKR
ncbi:TadE family type IV pilus minor pilin [Salinactinospora qingdaonensis]|uniref:TadE-like protein n=1 Tax=Salinactinospora qingdaonensis TaxID=702744 RepID=A0ABP7F6G0_9ACTN